MTRPTWRPPPFFSPFPTQPLDLLPTSHVSTISSPFFFFPPVCTRSSSSSSLVHRLCLPQFPSLPSFFSACSMQKSVKESVSRTRSRGIIEFFCIESFPLAVNPEATRDVSRIQPFLPPRLCNRVIRIRDVCRAIFAGSYRLKSREGSFCLFRERGNCIVCTLHRILWSLHSSSSLKFFSIPRMRLSFSKVLIKICLLRNCVSYVDYSSFREKSLSRKYLKNPSNFHYLQKIHHSFQNCKTAFYSLEKRCFETFSKYHSQSNNNLDFWKIVSLIRFFEDTQVV